MKGTCYVSMPFGCKTRAQTGEEVDFDAIYETLIQPAVAEFELESVRADSYGPGLVLQSLFRSILDSDLVIADLTLQNPNVLYELGIRHALRPTGTIVIQAAGGTIPFNLSGVMVMFYPLADRRVPSEELNDARKRIGHLIERTLRAERADSPVYAMLPELVAPDVFRGTGIGTGTGSGTSRGLAGTGTGTPNGRQRLRKSVRSMVKQFGTGAGGESEEEIPEAPEEETVEPQVPLSVILEEFRRAGDLGATIAYVDQLPADKAQDRAAVHELALALSKRGGEGDLDRAVAVCEDLVAREGGDPDTLGILGRVLRTRYRERGAAGDLEAAVLAYRRAFQLRPTEPSPGHAALHMLKLEGRLEPQDELLLHARTALNQKYNDLPQEAWSFWDLATRLDLAIFARDWQAADATLEPLLRASSDDWQVQVVRQTLETIASASPEDRDRIALLDERLQAADLTEGARS